MKTLDTDNRLQDIDRLPHTLMFKVEMHRDGQGLRGGGIERQRDGEG